MLMRVLLLLATLFFGIQFFVDLLAFTDYGTINNPYAQTYLFIKGFLTLLSIISLFFASKKS